MAKLWGDKRGAAERGAPLEKRNLVQEKDFDGIGHFLCPGED